LNRGCSSDVKIIPPYSLHEILPNASPSHSHN
jgi:hypothetical protein